MSITNTPASESPQGSIRNKVAKTYAFVSLGCPKNLVDSERMLGLLQLDGYRLVPDPAGRILSSSTPAGSSNGPARSRTPRSTKCSP